MSARTDIVSALGGWILERSAGGGNTPQIRCRGAQPQDFPQVAALFQELQRFHHQPLHELDDILRSLDAGRAAPEIIVAEAGGMIFGFALISAVPGPSLSSSLYLKELFVTSSARRLGLGRILMRDVARAAVARGFARVEWITTRNNTQAQDFYGRIGAAVVADKVFYKLEAAALASLIQ